MVNDNNNTDDHGWTIYKLFQMFHTTIRNSIILTALSLTLLGYSRYYRSKKNYLYNISFIVLSLLFVCCSIIVNSLLLYDQIYIANIMKKQSNKEALYLNIIQKWYIIPVFLIIANISIGAFGTSTLFRLL